MQERDEMIAQLIAELEQLRERVTALEQENERLRADALPGHYWNGDAPLGITTWAGAVENLVVPYLYG